MSISTHVLDTASGRPAAGIEIVLERREGEGDDFVRVTTATTDADGRVGGLVAAGELTAGVHRITFAVGDWHRANGVEGFYPEVAITFEVRDADEHHHVPLLLSPFGFTTYRGN